MPSNIVVNILVLVALVGLTVFGAVTTIDFIDLTINNQRVEETDKTIIENTEASEQGNDLKVAFIELRQKNEELEQSIATKNIVRNQLERALLELENKKVSIEEELEELQVKRSKLNETLLELNNKININSNLTVQNTKERNLEIENYKKLLKDFAELEVKNKELEENSKVLQASRAQVISELSLELRTLRSRVKDNDDVFLEKEEIFEKEISALQEKVYNLKEENDEYVKQLSSQKANYLRQIELEKAERDLISKSDNEIRNLKNFKSNFEQLNGLRVIFSGNMIYDERRRQIVFRADNSIGIPIFQDDFTGSIAGKCGLPIDKEIENRCSATIIAEFVVENSKLFLRGKEIVEIIRK